MCFFGPAPKEKMVFLRLPFLQSHLNTEKGLGIRLWLGLFVLHKWWFYMTFTVFCCTFMNHCNPDSSTKTHISPHTKHVFFNNSSLQKLHISPHPEHVFFHKGSHILSPKHVYFQRPFHRKFTYLPTQTMPSFKESSTEYSHILSPNTCLLTCLLSMKQRQHM